MKTLNVPVVLGLPFCFFSAAAFAAHEDMLPVFVEWLGPETGIIGGNTLHVEGTFTVPYQFAAFAENAPKGFWIHYDEFSHVITLAAKVHKQHSQPILLDDDERYKGPRNVSAKFDLPLRFIRTGEVLLAAKPSSRSRLDALEEAGPVAQDFFRLKFRLQARDGKTPVTVSETRLQLRPEKKD